VSVSGNCTLTCIEPCRRGRRLRHPAERHGLVAANVEGDGGPGDRASPAAASGGNPRRRAAGRTHRRRRRYRKGRSAHRTGGPRCARLAARRRRRRGERAENERDLQWFDLSIPASGEVARAPVVPNLGLDQRQDDHREHSRHSTTERRRAMPGTETGGIGSGRLSVGSVRRPNDKGAPAFATKIAVRDLADVCWCANRRRIGRINAISDRPITTDLSTARQPTRAFALLPGAVPTGREDAALSVGGAKPALGHAWPPDRAQGASHGWHRIPCSSDPRGFELADRHSRKHQAWRGLARFRERCRPVRVFRVRWREPPGSAHRRDVCARCR
jgi:hypothetical protein